MYQAFTIQKANNGYILYVQSSREEATTLIFSNMDEVFTKIKEIEGKE